jgi:catechol 2,3-dioxygenase-like lactoylglutathione lyase family enzyme
MSSSRDYCFGKALDKSVLLNRLQRRQPTWTSLEALLNQRKPARPGTSGETLERDRDQILIKRLSRVSVGVRDLDRQCDFYVNAYGLEVVDRAPGRVYFRAAEGPRYALELTADRRGLCYVAFEVGDYDELDRSARILRERGVRIELGPDRGVEPGVGKLLRFRDPEGNPIELLSDVEGVDDAHVGLVARFTHIEGYRLLSLTRAS